MRSKIAAANRYTRLRNTGVPRILSAHAAYFLSGGIVGERGNREESVPLAALALRVPDAEAFLPDWLAERDAPDV